MVSQISEYEETADELEKAIGKGDDHKSKDQEIKVGCEGDGQQARVNLPMLTSMKFDGSHMNFIQFCSSFMEEIDKSSLPSGGAGQVLLIRTLSRSVGGCPLEMLSKNKKYLGTFGHP